MEIKRRWRKKKGKGSINRSRIKSGTTRNACAKLFPSEVSSKE
jgi:stalled ribosome alternative rescue factor ArfA